MLARSGDNVTQQGAFAFKEYLYHATARVKTNQLAWDLTEIVKGGVYGSVRKVIRVVYTWRVSAENHMEFVAAWKQATTSIRETVRGARGSVMLRSRDNPERITTIARWDSVEDWQSFFQGDVPEKMNKMHELARRISVEAYDEIDDFTL